MIHHAGIYYTPGTLRAKLCVSGKHMLYDYCKEKGIRHKRPGKLLVATDKQQVARLKQFLKVGAENNVELRVSFFCPFTLASCNINKYTGSPGHLC